jgi:hypothetical protein
MRKWRVFWVLVASPRLPMLAGWAEVVEHEASTGIRSGDPIRLAPDYRIGKLLSLYTRSQDRISSLRYSTAFTRASRRPPTARSR